jgi:class 3 adenylate cyclase/CheY-like chemotaxis protein
MLFTDIVGSTTMLSSLQSSVADAARGRHFAGMRAALAAHEGTEVKTLGDGFMATFESASDALACAVTMQSTVARENRLHPERELSLRVGLSAGEVTVDEGDYFGIPVVEASRLCDAAGPGQILVADVLRVLVGSGGMHRMASVGELRLKGLLHPTRALEVDWGADDDHALRVALADDSVLLREGIASVLEGEGFDVVQQASTADELIDGMVVSRPDVVVMDVRMPPTHTTEGLEAAGRIRDDHPEVGVLMLSASVDAGAARRLLSRGTDGIGYLLKERITDVSELVAAIRTVSSGGSVIDPDVVGRLVEAV